ncbi:MAG TPA: ATP-binding protein [Luteimonas sp.]|jgi:signal transduction histidine kinase/CheY-like chemotaxis protein|nr:ATP-binding protein [Luteimonas sp.]
MTLRLPGTRSFRDKVTWVVAVTSAVAIALVAVALAAVNHFALRNAAFDALHAQAQVAAMNSGAPLVFGDRDTAAEVLGAFQAMPGIDRATLYTLDGTVFARYRRAARDGEAGNRLLKALPATERRFVTTLPVEEKGQRLGRLEVSFDPSTLERQLWQSAVLALALAVVAILLAFVASSYLAALVTRPVAILTRTAQRVSDRGDYALRAPRVAGDDELARLTASFNGMLERIERQDLDLEASREQAEQASRMKDEFLATLSHELRTPMTPILGWAQILRRLAGADAKVAQAAEVIERNAIAQTRIIDDLLDMSRIVSGKIRLEVRGYDPREVVDAALDAVRAAAQARGVALESSVEPGVPLLRGDPQRIQQVLWNLLSNATKFTGKDGRVRIDARLATDDAGDEVVRIRVADTGLGIAPAFLPHVFERFRQADSSATRNHGGLGLGLAIVKQLVELHGGTVSAQSAGLGQGATFTLDLPVPQGAHAAPVAIGGGAIQTHAAGRVPPGVRVLVVDDEADAREWVARVLADAGADVRAVASSDEAMRCLQGFRPQVLVSDIGMPGRDGYALIRDIRMLPDAALSAVPALALTAFARAEDGIRALTAGYQLHLGKPVDEARLLAAVASLVDG